jgi:hypothetical protein
MKKKKKKWNKKWKQMPRMGDNPQKYHWYAHDWKNQKLSNSIKSNLMNVTFLKITR